MYLYRYGMPTLEEIAHRNQLEMLRRMTPEQLAAASLQEQGIQQRSQMRFPRAPIHYSGLQGVIEAQPRMGLLAQLARMFEAQASP